MPQCSGRALRRPDLDWTADRSQLDESAMRQMDESSAVPSGKRPWQQVLAERGALQPEDLDYTVLGTQRTQIVGAQNRGITLAQLRRVRQFIQAHTIDEEGTLAWLDLAPAEFNVGRLHTASINLYQVTNWIIAPATKPYSASLVELLCEPGTTEQKASVFVSHWWGEPAFDFIRTTELETAIRALGTAAGNKVEYKSKWDINYAGYDDACFWICAYSNNQHELSLDISDAPKKTSFYLAMEMCSFVLLVLDKDATPFSRIWCCFEESMLCQGLKAQHGVKLDIATVTGDGPQLLTEGVATRATAGDGRVESQFGKYFREQDFPFELLRLGWSIEISTAQASVPADFNRIINTINGVPAEQLSTVEPELGHEACERVNRMLRVVFAEAAAGKAAEHPGMLEQAMELLAKDAERTELIMDFTYCPKLTDVSAVGSAVSQLKSLQKLTLNFSCCDGLTDVSAVVGAVSQLKSLQKFTLNFSHCSKLTDVGAVVSAVSQLKSLQQLDLDLQGCSNLTGMCCLEARLRKALPGAEIKVDIEGMSSCCCRCTIC